MRLLKGLLLGAAALGAVASQANAQAYPSQGVKIVVPFGAGSITDNLARIIADKLGPMWKQQVLVENRPGLPGTTAAAKADKDGYTLMLTSNGHTVARTINKNAQFDPVADFSGITRVVETPFTMIIPPSLPAKNLKEFIDLAKKDPGKYNFSSPGVASSTFLVSESFAQAAGIKLVHVPFKSVPEAVTAALRGDVAFYFAPITDAQAQTAGGKVRSLAVTAPQRLKRQRLVRHHGARRHAEGDYRQGQRRHHHHSQDGRRRRAYREARFAASSDHSGGIRCHHQGRHGALCQDDGERRHWREVAPGAGLSRSVRRRDQMELPERNEGSNPHRLLPFHLDEPALARRVLAQRNSLRNSDQPEFFANASFS